MFARVIFVFIYIQMLFLGISCVEKKHHDTSLYRTVKMNEMYDLALESKLKSFQSISDGDVDANRSYNTENKAREHLGHTLYFDSELLGNKNCNSCHNLANYGIERKTGLEPHVSRRNTISISNAVLDSIQFWDGSGNRENHIQKHIYELGGQSFWIKKLNYQQKYKKLFSEAFPGQKEQNNIDNVQLALLSFEEKLKTPTAFDRYLDGDATALSLQQKMGLLTFINVGCIDCHSGSAIGGDMVKKFGVYRDYWAYTYSTDIDEGRYKVTGKLKDRFVFGVPSLRNVAKTAPYFHDGSVQDLKRAVEIMANVQLNYRLTKEELDNITSFLQSLTGDPLPIIYLSAPN